MLAVAPQANQTPPAPETQRMGEGGRVPPTQNPNEFKTHTPIEVPTSAGHLRITSPRPQVTWPPALWAGTCQSAKGGAGAKQGSVTCGSFGGASSLGGESSMRTERGSQLRRKHSGQRGRTPAAKCADVAHHHHEDHHDWPLPQSQGLPSPLPLPPLPCRDPSALPTEPRPDLLLGRSLPLPFSWRPLD